MTMRVQEIRECDRAKCRRRKGVRGVAIYIEALDAADCKPQRMISKTGELCPYHLKLAISQTAAMFDNTKDYPEEVKYNG